MNTTTQTVTELELHLNPRAEIKATHLGYSPAWYAACKMCMHSRVIPRANIELSKIADDLRVHLLNTHGIEPIRP